MSEKGKSHLETITAAMNLLPEKNREYIVGYAEGVIAARTDSSQEKAEKEKTA